MMGRPTDDEIIDQRELAAETAHATKWPAMSYEQGVETALDWVLGNGDEPPMAD